MDGWLTAVAITGKWVLILAIGVFVPTMIALVMYALRNGEPGDADVAPSIQPFGPYAPTGRRGVIVYKGARKLRMLASRETYVSMETLLSGTATRGQWALFGGIQVCLACFWLIIISFWFFGVLKAVWDDIVAARKTLAGKRKVTP